MSAELQAKDAVLSARVRRELEREITSAEVESARRGFRASAVTGTAILSLVMAWQAWRSGWEPAVAMWAVLLLGELPRWWRLPKARAARVLPDAEIRHVARHRRVCAHCEAAPYRFSPSCSGCGHLHSLLTWMFFILLAVLIVWFLASVRGPQQ